MDRVYFFTDLDELSSECEQHRSTNDMAIMENLTIRLKNVVRALQNGSREVFLKYYIPCGPKLFQNFHGKTHRSNLS